MQKPTYEALTHQWLDRLAPCRGLAPKLLPGKQHKAHAFCATAALSRPTAWGNQHSKRLAHPEHSFCRPYPCPAALPTAGLWLL